MSLTLADPFLSLRIGWAVTAAMHAKMLVIMETRMSVDVKESSVEAGRKVWKATIVMIL